MSEKRISDLFNQMSGLMGSNDRARLVAYERPRAGHSVNFELESVYEMYSIPMQYILNKQPVPHAEAMKALFSIMTPNQILEEFRKGDGASYPHIIKFLDTAEELRQAFIAYL